MTLIDFLRVHKDDLKENNLLKVYEDLLNLDNYDAEEDSELTFAHLSNYFLSRGINPLKYTNGIVPIACFSEMTLSRDFKLYPGIRIIKQNAFEFVDGMERFFAAPGLEEIEMFVFDECQDLKHLYLPSSLIKIPEGSFITLPHAKAKDLIIHTPMNSVAWKYAEHHGITRDNLYRY